MIYKASASKHAFRQHLINIGFRMNTPPDMVMRELKQHMGEARFREYNRVTQRAGLDRNGGRNPVYDFMQDLTEANLLRSLSPDVTLDTNYYLYEKALPYLKPGKRVIELGCWTGGLTSFVAQNHPECSVVGVDRVERLLEISRQHYRLPNLSFVQWDYCQAKPQGLEPADILLCGLGTTNGCPPGVYSTLDPLGVRGSAGYEHEKQEGVTYFTHWREAAKEEAVLLSVLRILTFPRFLAFMDAAQMTGWAPLLDQCTHVQCPANEESLPALLFHTGASEPLDEDTMLSHWMRICGGQHEFARLAGPSALVLYRSLGNRRVLATREYRNERGLLVREELGVCGALGYVYGQDSLPTHRLVLTTIPHAEMYRSGFRASVAISGSIGANNTIMSLDSYGPLWPTMASAVAR